MPAYLARVALTSSHGAAGATYANVFHVEAAQLTSPFNAAATAADVDTWLTTLYRAVLLNADYLHNITVTSVVQPGQDPAQAVVQKNVAGTRAGADSKVSGAISQVLSLKTDVPRRYARGHMFLPPPWNASCLADNGTFDQSNAYWTAATAFKNALLAGHAGSDVTYTLVVYSPTQQARAATPFYWPVSTIVQQPKQHWLRSREDLA